VREISEAAEQVENPFALSRVQQLQRPVDHFAIHFHVDLDKIRGTENQANSEFGYFKIQFHAGRFQAGDTVGTGRLQQDGDAGFAGEFPQLFQVTVAQWFEMPKYQCALAVTAGHLQLRDRAFRLHRANQAGKAAQLAGDTGVQDMALPHIGHESPVTLPKTDQNPLLFVHVANGKPGLSAISPFRPCQGIPQGFRRHLANPLQVLDQGVLLGLDLFLRIEMLEGTAAALPEMSTAWMHAIRRSFHHLHGLALVMASFAFRQSGQHQFAG
jgi:hypothetical protein